MRGRFEELSGRRFGRLVVVAVVIGRGSRGEILWNCLCDCGTKRAIAGRSLVSGRTQSCGCLRKERLRKHGCGTPGSRSPEYRSWLAMNERCMNPDSKDYPRYGAQGIHVCDRWRGEHGFENFLADLGARPIGTTLDRKINDLGYSPENCRWSTFAEQTQNRSFTKLSIEKVCEIRSTVHLGMSLKDLADRFHVHTSTIYKVLSGEAWKEAKAA